MSSSAAHHTGGNDDMHEFTRNTCSMHRAANHFARSLESKQAESTNLHVQGSESMFSLYAFDDVFLAFYSAVGIDAEINLMKIDTEIAKNIEEMRLLLQHLRNRDGVLVPSEKNLAARVKLESPS